MLYNLRSWSRMQVNIGHSWKILQSPNIPLVRLAEELQSSLSRWHRFRSAKGSWLLDRYRLRVSRAWCLYYCGSGQAVHPPALIMSYPIIFWIFAWRRFGWSNASVNLASAFSVISWAVRLGTRKKSERCHVFRDWKAHWWSEFEFYCLIFLCSLPTAQWKEFYLLINVVGPVIPSRIYSRSSIA